MSSRSVQPAGSPAPEPRRASSVPAVPLQPGGAHTTDQVAEVLRRAMELAEVDMEGLGGTLNPESVLGQASLVEIANELDIPLDAVAGALVEARLDVSGGSQSLLDRFVGPSEVWARRSTSESEAEVEARLITWLERGHGLKPRVRQNGVLVAKRRRDLVGKLGKTVRGVQGAGGLAKAQVVEAVVVDLGSEADAEADRGVNEEFDSGTEVTPRGSIGLSADLTDRRSVAITKGAAVAVGGTLVVSLVSVVVAPMTLLVLPVAAGAGLLTSRKLHSSTVRSMTDAVEETIDGIVTQTDPPRLLGGLRRRSR